MKKISFIALLIMTVAILLNSCGRQAPPPKEDFTPPTVISQTPGHNSTGVSINTSISIVFSEPMDESSVNTSTFLVSDRNSNTIHGVVTCSAAAATFTPLAPLDFSTTYVVAITTGARDKSGNSMFMILNFVFTTEEYQDKIPPHVLDTAPTGTNVGVNAVIVVMFDEDMRDYTFTPQSITVSDGTTTSIPGELQVSNRMVIFQPTGVLKKLTTYTVVVAGSVEDMSSNPMGQPYTWQFTTKETDTENPFVVNTYPTGSATGASINAAIIVTFNESMNESSITPASMSLTEKNQSGDINIAGTITASGATAVLTPTTALKYNTNYVVTLVPGWNGPASGITDLAGNRLTENSPSGYTWTFRTEAFPSFVIVATAGAGGTINPVGLISVAYDGAQMFTITPNTGYHVVNVLVDNVSVGAVNTYSFTNVKANHSISASFAINNYTLSITKSGTGNGDVQTSPWKDLVWLNSTATPTFDHGTTVILTAYEGTPTAPSTFSGWTGCNSVNGNQCTVTMNSAKSVTATFTLNNYTLSVTKAGLGSGNVTPNTGTLIWTGSTGTASYPYNTPVILTAAALAGSTFTGWSGEGCTGTGTCTVNVTAYRSVTATFTLNNFTVTATAGTGGTISPASRLVSYGSTTTFTVTPNTGYTAAVGGTCGGTLVGTTYTTNAIIAPCTVSATFTLNGVTVTATAGTGGTISPASRVVSYGSATTFTVTPNTGYSIGIVSGCTGTLSGNTYTTGPITAPCTVDATFTINTFTITPSAGPNGTISPSTPQIVSYGTSTTFTFTPSTGYYISAVTVDGASVGLPTSYTFNNVTANHTISVSFTLGSYVISATAGTGGTLTSGGTIVSSGTSQDFLMSYGGNRSFTIAPNAGYSTTSILVDGVTTTLNPYSFTNVTANHTISATFTLNSYTVTATAGSGGTITPASRLVSHGSTTTFTVTPSANYTAAVGGTCGGTLVGTTYTTNPVTAPCTVDATFTLNAYTLTATAGSGGTIAPASRLVSYGSTTTFTVTPDTGYSIGAVGGTCGGLLVGTTYTTNAITADCTVSATFTLNSYTVTATAGANGTISPTSRLVSYGSATTFTVIPSANYTAAVGGTCGGTLVGTTYTTNPVTAPCTVDATFTLNAYTVTATAGANGTISPASRLVGYNSTTTFTVTPNTGYTAAVGGTCGGTLVGTTYTTSPITAPCTVSATFTLNAYTVTATAGANGTISPASRSVGYNSTTTFTVTPTTGYTAVVGGTCGGTLVGTNYETNPIIGDCTVSATFTLNAYTVTPSAGVNGTISPATPQTVNHGSATAFTVTPTTGYSTVMGGTCGGTLVGTTYTTNAIIAPCTVTAAFTLNSYTVTPSAGANGTISPATPQTVNHGSATAFTVTPTTGYHIVTPVGGTCGGALVGNTYTTNAITANCTVAANFAIDTFAINFGSGGNGTLTGTTSQTVNYNGSATAVTAVPSTGYHFVNWTGTGGFVTTTTNPLTVANVTAAQTITANFAIDTFAVNFISGGNGTLTGTTSQTVNYNGSATAVTAVPSTGYHFVNWTGTGGFVTTTTNPLTVANITAAQTITANFAINTYTVSTSAGFGGSIAPTSATVNYNSTTTLTVSAIPLYYITSVSGCSSVGYSNSDPAITTYNYTTEAITADCTVTATYDVAPLAPIGATQGIGFGSLGAMSFLLNHKLFGNLFRRRRKQTGSRGNSGKEG